MIKSKSSEDKVRNRSSYILNKKSLFTSEVFLIFYSDYKAPLKPKRRWDVIDKRDKLNFKLNFLCRSWNFYSERFRLGMNIRR